MAAPIRSSVEIAAILNKGKNAIGDIGHDIIGDAKRGLEFDTLEFRDKAYRLIFLRAFIKNIVDPTTGEINAYYSASTNEKKLNIMLDAIVQLCGTLGGPNSIPLIQGTRVPVVFYPSTSGTSSGGGGSGGSATPGGVTFQNLDVDAPGEVVDSWDASANNFAFYLVEAIGSGGGEGSGFFIVGVNVRGSSDPVITEYHGSGVGGSITGVSFSAALNGGMLEFTCNVPSDNWVVRGTRIQFQNISFLNTQGPLPTGGTVGQYLRKSSSTDYDAAWAAILMSEVTGLSAAIASIAILSDGVTPQKKYKEIDIGPWDMSQATGSATLLVPHGISNWQSIRILSVDLNDDGLTGKYPINFLLFSSPVTMVGATVGGTYGPTDSSDIKLWRGPVGGFFDSGSFDDTGISRGTIVITYED